MSEPVTETPAEVVVQTTEPAAESSTAPAADAVMDDAAETEKKQKASKQSKYWRTRTVLSAYSNIFVKSSSTSPMPIFLTTSTFFATDAF